MVERPRALSVVGPSSWAFGYAVFHQLVAIHCGQGAVMAWKGTPNYCVAGPGQNERIRRCTGLTGTQFSAPPTQM